MRFYKLVGSPLFIQGVQKNGYRLKSSASDACWNLNALLPNEPRNALNVGATELYYISGDRALD